MSAGRTGLLLMLSLVAAAAMCFVCLSDDSSAERGDREEQPPEGRPECRGFMQDPKGAVAIDPGYVHDDPFSMVMDFEKVSAEKRQLESQGMEVFVIRGPGMGHQPVFDEIVSVIGQDRFITPEQACSMEFGEIVDMDMVSECAEDDSFLQQVSGAISAIDPDAACAVDNVLSMRERIRSYELYQKAVAAGYCSASDRRDDSEDEEDIEDKVVFEEEETDSREPVVFEVPIIQISDSYGMIGVITEDSSAVLMHGAADGPGL